LEDIDYAPTIKNPDYPENSNEPILDPREAMVMKEKVNIYLISG
jgi:hypothetical protein